MSAKTSKPIRKVFVSAENLTAKNLGPTAMELFALMHLTTCDLADRAWKDHWHTCPVCGAFGSMPHKPRAEITH